MEKLLTWLKNHHIIYVNRSFERASGMDMSISDFSIISNVTEFAKSYAQERSHIVLIDTTTLLDSWQLLEHPKSLAYIAKKTKECGENAFGGIMVYKPTKKIERICKTHNIPLLNPLTNLASNIEEKISQVAWLGTMTTHLPPHHIDVCKNIAWNYEPFVLQFNQGHTGSGTVLIDSEIQLQELQKTFPERPVKVSAYINGPTFTCNGVVSKDAIHTGSLSYQITGLSPFTDQPFATIGNDWGLPKDILSYDQQAKCKEIAHAVGKKMQHDGWRGAFGIDIIVEEETGNVYLLEINARQPASVIFESHLQQQSIAKQVKNLMTTFEAHVAALANLETKDHKLVPVTRGAQLVLRLTKDAQDIDVTQTKKALEQAGLSVIPYTTTTLGSDLLRIQSKESIMTKHGVYNALGKKIVTIIENAL
ncbi:MAG: ATP-grasp domain-containing protein [Candidatus Magasanikbacteria bacterium]|jgi:hypothetical protein|nr:ATP-grasp domain-containing protein [Candidatus Magasanikbacteria bacterium]MBT5262441.1 ATP-grasp domain-containing protein [Candidatus Magasanikbacteria bacterium]MBT5820436.1 ATP-grasp domain-containing protein [Candidatus Magasanikbacteria bacterium]MBT6294460.1 ATP-grasp domain-containing protein [Candidatus Magasanikbacteria bacterium]